MIASCQKSYYCVAVTIMEIDELNTALEKAKRISRGKYIESKAKILRSIVDIIDK